MARLYPHRTMSELTVALLRSAGTPADEAVLTADHLVTSSLMGHDSHGVLRVPSTWPRSSRGRSYRAPQW